MSHENSPFQINFPLHFSTTRKLNIDPTRDYSRSEKSAESSLSIKCQRFLIGGTKRATRHKRNPHSTDCAFSNCHGEAGESFIMNWNSLYIVTAYRRAKSRVALLSHISSMRPLNEKWPQHNGKKSDEIKTSDFALGPGHRRVSLMWQQIEIYYHFAHRRAIETSVRKRVKSSQRSRVCHLKKSYVERLAAFVLFVALSHCYFAYWKSESSALAAFCGHSKFAVRGQHSRKWHLEHEEMRKSYMKVWRVNSSTVRYETD